MRFSWGQGKIEVEKHHQEIVDLLSGGLTQSRIFLHLKNERGLLASKRTFHRTVRAWLAEPEQAGRFASAPRALTKASVKALPKPKPNLPVTQKQSSDTRPSSEASSREVARSRSSLDTKALPRAGMGSDEQYWGS